MNQHTKTEHTETLVIGGGQAGLAMAYHLSKLGLEYTIIDANHRVGDAWRNRWDSLRLFTPARLDSLPGLPFPGYHWGFPSKDEMADYLENYAKHFDIDVQTGTEVDRLSRETGSFVVTSGDRRFVARNVVVAMSSWQKPRIPAFASDLDYGILQIHASSYRNPGQLQDGSVLVVGAGNSGAEIAKELSRTREVWLSGPDTGHLPFRPESVAARILMPFVGRVVFHRVLTTGTPIGRRARPKMKASGEPLIRVKPKDLAESNVRRVPRVTSVQHGQPELEDGQRIEPANIVWCTGFQPGFSWIDLPGVNDGGGEPNHERGIATDVPGLYFIGLKFLYSVSSEQIHGVGRDAAYVAEAIRASGVTDLDDRRADRTPDDLARSREHA